jgi:hypothetical protein
VALSLFSVAKPIFKASRNQNIIIQPPRYKPSCFNCEELEPYITSFDIISLSRPEIVASNSQHRLVPRSSASSVPVIPIVIASVFGAMIITCIICCYIDKRRKKRRAIAVGEGSAAASESRTTAPPHVLTSLEKQRVAVIRDLLR